MDTSLQPSIVYMGTPHFAVEPLKAILDRGWNVSAVVTTPDKPAGRGQKIAESPVKAFAKQMGLNVLQPERLKDEQFVNTLKALNPDIAVVVAFRMLPEAIWQIPRLGTFNLHASLLPQYRGAAPINWAVMNGETITGLTTFLIDREIDTGKILFRHEVPIGEAETAGELHDKLMMLGGSLVIKTIEALMLGSVEPKQQQMVSDPSIPLKAAPKLFKDTCRVNWSNTTKMVFNQIRGLSPYPGAWSHLTLPDGSVTTAKLLLASPTSGTSYGPGKTKVENGKLMSISCGDGCIAIDQIQLAGKRAMETAEFLRGLRGGAELHFF
jgi:methionyl-tRNA formyltransferase